MILLLGRTSETNSSATPTARFNDSRNSLIEKKTPQTNTSTPQTNTPAPQTNTPTPQTNTPAPQTNTPTLNTSDLEPAEDPEVIRWLEVMSWSSDDKCKQAVRERYATTEFSELNCGSIYLFNILAPDYFNCAEDEKCQMLKHFCKKSPEAQDLLIRNEIQKCSGKPQPKITE
ncbi:hypothetical protein Bpfe_021726 [Biomphalaria pfeifferi]|uniref:Uncharacterized protein n=1 Tax=Biomphalaria pfeifferi TaxID=112525 RepID=A0AAD8B677_BIOPF|nr:hypothetical protein Bpfe_021726 [Biomphalaria pfeifferi]